MNCAELFGKFIEYKSVFVCSRTIEKYVPLIPYLKECYGDRDIATIGKADVTIFIQKIQSEGKSTENLKRKLFYLKACWDWAIECDFCQKNPWKNLPRMVREEKTEQPDPFTAEEIQKIIEGFQSFPEYRQLIPYVRFLFGTGCRTSEVIGLTWGDISPDANQVKIISQLTRGIRKAPKTGRVRVLKLPKNLSRMLLEMRSENFDPNQLIFLWNGKPIDAMGFRVRPWKKVLTKMSISYRKPYCTRHTFISHCLEKGMNPTAVGKICGNSTRVIYQHYAGALHNPEIPEIC